ncbi:hypothetical protein F1880_007352 [Penicillium rolfsii]|nr:hypothetical protein F1880_007352 [Penicillium rolfsii]
MCSLPSLRIMTPTRIGSSYLLKLVDSVYSEDCALPCAYLTGSDTLCKGMMKKKRAEEIKQLFGMLVECLDVSSGKLKSTHTVEMFIILGKIAALCVCTRSHTKHAIDAQNKWRQEMDDPVTGIAISNKLLSYVRYREEAIMTNANLDKPQEFKRRLSGAVTDDQIAVRVTKLLESNLGDNDWRMGFIYVIAHPRAEGMYKVGYTTSKKHPNAGRFADHERCYPELKVVKCRSIPRARRFEQVILAEFSREHHELQETCTHCKRAHKEWLKIDKETLLKSLEKWATFADSHDPYDDEGRFKNDIDLPSPALNLQGRKRLRDIAIPKKRKPRYSSSGKSEGPSRPGTSGSNSSSHSSDGKSTTTSSVQVPSIENLSISDDFPFRNEN